MHLATQSALPSPLPPDIYSNGAARISPDMLDKPTWDLHLMEKSSIDRNTANQPETWLRYLAEAFSADDCYWIPQDLYRDQQRLFVCEERKVSLETWSYSGGGSLLKTFTTTDDALETSIQGFQDHKTNIFFIPQVTSWSRLKISFPMFARLCQFLTVPPSFLELVSTFGYKRSDTDNQFSAVFRNIRSSALAGDFERTYELCYNVRYVQLQEKQRKDPWSFRNFAVLQSLRPHSGKSNWVFISVEGPIKEQLERSTDVTDCKPTSALIWHTHFLAFCMSNWRGYINYLDAQVRKITDATTFTTLNNSSGSDFSIDFSTCQTLGWLRNKLERSLDVLRSYGSIENAILAQLEELESENVIQPTDRKRLANLLHEQLVIANCHERRVQTLLKSCDFAAQMMFQLLGFRNDDRIHKNGFALQELARSASAETQSMAYLSLDACVNSRGTRILGFITLAYAPAAIVSGIFSSNLVEVSNDNGNRLTVRREMWIFTALAIVLGFLTVIGGWYLEKRQKQRLLQEQKTKLGHGSFTKESIDLG